MRALHKVNVLACGLVFSGSISLLAPVKAQQMFKGVYTDSTYYSCPKGSAVVGGGYCRSTSGKQFVPGVRIDGYTYNCPQGSKYAGWGYCAF